MLEVKFMFRIVVSLAFILSFAFIHPCLASAPNVVNPRLGGAETVMILSIIPTFIDHIISAPNITTTEQLRGKIGSVNRFGSISDMGLRLSLRRLGIDPEKDVKIVPAGGNPERLSAIL